LSDSEKRRAQKAAACRRWRAAHPGLVKAYRQRYADYDRDRKRFALTGWTAEEYAAAHDKQLGQCAICLKARPLRADHDHKTGRRRDLLCDRCNRSIGAFEDSPELLSRAAEYLERHAKGTT
jgi:hypothetical protein